ncbi:SUMF1/EgtB/PvdO family nonheme iron enzyme [Candidatus Pacearchaeota archaeon]|nr:SUMF1/EgtB/PvdO family nonheme iron enzyme [Candidatus Pacearchaeota archaeon]
MPNPVCPTGTTYVPGGRFRGGTKVIKGVCIDTKPVSNNSYNEFLMRTNRTLPSYRLQSSRRGLEPLALVRNVSYKDAREYCQSRGMRLPTEKEWQAAFMISGQLLSMGMKDLLGKIPPEYIESGRSSKSASITGVPLGQKFLFNFSSGWPASYLREPTRFRCAVEPKTTQDK